MSPRPLISLTRVNGRRLWPGAALAGAVAVVADAVSAHWPVAGAPLVALILGVLWALGGRVGEFTRPGINAVTRPALQLAVVALGASLSWGEVLSTGVQSLPVLVGTLLVALAATPLLGRLVGVRGDLRTLIGVGTAICGASAIAATDTVIEAPERDVAYAVATIFTFNVAAVLLFPPLGHLLHLPGRAFGLWSGTAVNDVSSVVAASAAYGHGASSYAVVVKLTRTLAIVPLTLALGWRRHRDSESHWAVRAGRAVPRFLPWFLLAVTLHSVGLLPRDLTSVLAVTASLLIAVALAGVGLSTEIAEIRRAGLRPLALGGALWVVVATSSLLLQGLTHA